MIVYQVGMYHNNLEFNLSNEQQYTAHRKGLTTLLASDNIS